MTSKGAHKKKCRIMMTKVKAKRSKLIKVLRKPSTRCLFEIVLSFLELTNFSKFMRNTRGGPCTLLLEDHHSRRHF